MADSRPPELAQARAAVITEMQSAVLQLRAVLGAEREALDRMDSVALDAATLAKADLLQRLGSLDGERCQLEGLGGPREATGAWRAICDQLEICRHLNEVNGSIVTRRLGEVRRALGILRGAGEGTPMLYGPGGQARASAAPRPLSQA